MVFPVLEYRKVASDTFTPASKMKSKINANFALLPTPFVMNFNGKQILNVLSAQIQTMIQAES
jgi:hypothetical protein